MPALLIRHDQRHAFVALLANLFMIRLEERLLEASPDKPLIWMRFIDDVFFIWMHGEEKLKSFINHLNSSHETIKFTSEQSRDSISFLDVQVSAGVGGVLATDLFCKPTDTHQYLHLTARIVQQEHAIETLNYHVNMMRGCKDQISSTKMSKKETKKNSKKLEIEDQSPSNLQFSNGTLNVQKPAKRTDKPWHNVCKSFNKGSCTRKKCKFEHKIVKTCYFYNQPDGCLKGKDCSFLHIKSTKNDTKSQKSQVHQNTLQANAHDVKPRNEMQSAPNDNDNMAMKDSFLEELGRKLLNSWITNQTSQLQPCQPTAYQPLTIAEPQRVIPWQTAPQQQPSQMYVQA